MSVFEAIVLGAIQGLTEFIPVSSSGHLVLAQIFFSGASDHFFLEWIDLGTLLALIIYFRHRIASIALDITVRRNYRLGRNLLLTTIPTGIIGLSFSGFIETSPLFSNVIIVASALGLIGVVMVVIDRLPHRSPVKDGEKLSKGRAFIVGLFQVFALIPGVSRSGSTIIAGRLMGLDSVKAAEYSFLASLPIMLGLMIKLVTSPESRQYFVVHAPMLILSNLVAFVTGLAAVTFLIGYLSRNGLAAFGWYRIILSAVLMGGILLQLIGK